MSQHALPWGPAAMQGCCQARPPPLCQAQQNCLPWALPLQAFGEEQAAPPPGQSARAASQLQSGSKLAAPTYVHSKKLMV